MELITESAFARLVELGWVTGLRNKPISTLNDVEHVEAETKVGGKVLVCWPRDLVNGRAFSEPYLCRQHIDAVGMVVEVDFVANLHSYIRVRLEDGYLLGLDFTCFVPIPDDVLVAKNKQCSPLISRRLFTKMIDLALVTNFQAQPVPNVPWQWVAERVRPGVKVLVCWPRSIDGGMRNEAFLPSAHLGHIGRILEISEVKESVCVVHCRLRDGSILGLGVDSVVPVPDEKAVVYCEGKAHYFDCEVGPTPPAKKISTSAEASAVFGGEEQNPQKWVMVDHPRPLGETLHDYMGYHAATYTQTIDLGEASSDRTGEAHIADFRDWLSAPMISRRRG